MVDLQDFRQSLDHLDNAIVYLFAERFRVTQKVGEFKKQNNLPARDEAREQAQIERVRSIAKEVGLDPDFAQKLFRLTMDTVVENHKKIQSSSDM